MILAGDIGGTKTVLALYRNDKDNSLICKHEQTFPSGEYSEFDHILTKFIPANIQITSACFGVAGPVVEQRCQTTNLPWTLDATELSSRLQTTKVKLLNDLEAMALGMLHLKDDDLVELNTNAQPRTGNFAVIAAGTGLGQAILYWDGQKHHAIATEGGHCDLAAQNEQQDMLLNYLRKRFNDHVSWERILCGNGFSTLYEFLCEYDFASPCPVVPDTSEQSLNGIDRNAIISRLGVNDEDPVCKEAVRLFVELYGAETGNLALKCLSTNGVFIGGGIGPKIRTALEDGTFLQAFTSKGRFTDLLGKMPIKLSLNPHTPLIGAANYFRK